MNRIGGNVIAVCSLLLWQSMAQAAEQPLPRRLEGNRPQAAVPLDDGRVLLFPEIAEFYGQEIRINPDNFCIAWWSKSEDYVAWKIESPKAAEFEVWLEWAIADEQVGNPFVLTVAGQKLAGKIVKSGGWTSLKRAKVGVIKLPAGKSRLELRPAGELHGELADVRAVTLNPVSAPPPPGAPDLPAKSAAASLNAIRVHPAMQVELVAAEPLVQDPIAIAWGADLKLWVVEMGDYPLGVDGKGAHGGRIKFLEDTNGDGRYDKATVFLDNLGFPTGIMPWNDGVLVSCAPDIFYAADINGDGRADVRKQLVTGFPQRNQQHRVNGLRLGLDNWVYCANGDGGVGGDTKITSVATGKQLSLGTRDLRFRPETGELEPQSGPTQFGRNRDDWGNWFGSNNGQPLYHFALDEHYLLRNTRLSPPDPRVHLFNINGPFHSIAPAIAFHGEKQSLAAGTHPVGLGGACSGMIYRDDLLGPEFAGNAFVCDPVTNLVHRRVLKSQGSTFTSQRADDEATSEFFASADPWTRPTMIQTGPDGALYIVDIYRLYIEHPQWIHPAVLARADLRAGCDRGRIYRIYPRNGKPHVARRLDKLDVPALVASLDSPSGWRRDTAQQRLIERADRAAVPLLNKLATQSPRPQTRLQALATSAGLSAADDKLLLAALKDAHPGVRRHAVRIAEPRSNKSPELAAAVVLLAKDEDSLVRMQVAYSLGEWNDPRAGARLGSLIAEQREDPYLVTAALSSAASQPVAVIGALLEAEPPLEEALLSRSIAACIPADAKYLEDLLLKEIAAVRDLNSPRRRFALLATLLDSSAAGEAARQRITTQAKPLFELARKVAIDSVAKDADRVAAMSVLGRQPDSMEADVETLAGQLSPSAPLPVAEAAIDRLALLEGKPIGKRLAGKMSELSPALRARAFEAILSRGAWSLALLEELARDERLASSIDSGRRQRLLTHAAADVRAAAVRAFGAPANTDRQKVVAEYAAAINERGDAPRGRAVFKTNCSACHRLEEVGNEVGPNLAGLKDKSPQALLEAVLNPSRAVEDKFIAYNATTTDGRGFSGLVKVESGNSITLAAADGRTQTILRSELDTLVSTGRSLMPDGFEKTITPGVMNDLIAYLNQSGGGVPVKPTPSNLPAVVAADSSGTIRLLPTQAKLHGSHVGVNPGPGCIAWMAEGERAEWTIEVPSAGKYELKIEWAQVDELADNPFAVEAGPERIAGKFPSTGGWEKYQSRVFGQLLLPAGKSTLTLKPNGPVKTELADIRAVSLVPAARAK